MDRVGCEERYTLNSEIPNLETAKTVIADRSKSFRRTFSGLEPEVRDKAEPGRKLREAAQKQRNHKQSGIRARVDPWQIACADYRFERLNQTRFRMFRKCRSNLTGATSGSDNDAPPANQACHHLRVR